jgi:hypothetical protein
MANACVDIVRFAGTSARAISWPRGHFEMGDPQTGKRK